MTTPARCPERACVGVLDDTGVCNVCRKKSPTWVPPRRTFTDELADSMADRAVQRLTGLLSRGTDRDDDDDND